MTEPQPLIQPLANIDAEEDVLGAMLINESSIEAVLDVLEPDGADKFYRTTNGVIYTVIVKMYRDGKPIEPLTVAAAAPEHEQTIHEIAAGTIMTRNAGFKAGLVKKLWASRTLQQTLKDALRAVEEGNYDEAIDMAEANLMEVRHRYESSAPIFLDGFGMATAIDERIKNPLGVDEGVRAPFTFLPNMLPGRLYVIGGYTAHGKTSLAVQYARTALERGHSVGFFSIEMSGHQLGDRFAASFGVPLQQIETGRVTPTNTTKIGDALGKMAVWKIHVVDDTTSNAGTVARMQRLHKYDLIIIDHLHQITLPGKAGERRQALEDEVHAITTVARHYNVPVILLAQLSRPSEGKIKRPGLSDLRETSRIEQQAAFVGFIYRKHDLNGAITDESEFVTAKNRFGPTGVDELEFRGTETKFVEITNRYE